MSDIRQYNIDPNRNDNPRFYAVVDGFNDLSEKANRVIFDQRVLLPRSLIRVWRLKRGLKSLGRRIEKLEHERNDWKIEADTLLSNPSFIFQPEQPKELMFLHYTDIRWLMHEIDNNMIPNNSPTGENGNATCYSGGTLSDPSDDANTTGSDENDRRILVIAVLNCQALIQQGFSLNGNSKVPLPVQRFAKIFLTEPAQGTGNDKADIWGELVGALDPGELDGILHDIIQLYR